MNAEKESNPKKAAHKKEQKQAVILPLSLRETENANSQTQDPNIQERPASVENSSPTSGNESIPAVHGSSPAYSDGAEQKYQQLQTSLEKTGELDHPDTKQKEMEYKSTLGISELREYHDAKPAEAKPAAAAQADKKEELVPVATAAGTSSTDAPLKSPAIVDKGEVVNAESLEPVADKEEVPEAEDATPKTATANPVFLEMQDQITTTAKAQRKHGPAGKASQDAQAAAPSPANERQSKAQAGQVKKMSEQEPGTFSAAAFKAELKKKIAGMQLPKNEEQADNFEKNNNIKQVNEQAMGSVKKEKNAASGSIANTTSQKPDTGAQPVRNVAKMPTPDHGKAPSAINASKAMPSKRDAANIEKPIQSETDSIDNQMKEHGVTDSMLANSNEPSFKGALDEKNKAKEQSKAATNQFRTEEGQQINKTQNEAQAQAAQQISGMHGTRKGGLDKVLGNQQQTASKDTEKRKEIADKINKIYGDTKKDVDDILNGLDDTVAGKFAAGSKAAKIAFENHVDKEMAAYKKKRYGDSWLDWRNLKRVKDAVVGLPPEVNEFFTSGKEVYIKTMDVYIDNIANVVASQLNAAKRRIATGKKEVQNYVDTLSPSLKKLGAAAISEIQGKFNALEKDVDSKKDALIDVLAKKYVENIEAVDARIKALKELNGGLVGMALKALSGVFAFIIEVKNTLMSLLAKVVEVVGAIIMDPIGFFGNLIAGVGQGFSNFTTNIWTHLKTGFFSWLTGASKGITITMPEDIFSLKGIFSITMQVLSLGWEGIRSIGATVVGEPLMKVLETGVEIVQVVRKDGIAGLWEYLKDQFQDLKETVMDAIMDIIQNQVIQAGIKWILGLLSPVGAFVKAIMAIIDVVKFFVQRAAQIAELIKAFMDSVAAIASGKVGAVAVAIENALAKAIPVLIGLLASILGISGLADKVLAVIRKIRQRIVAGITKFWNFVKEKGKGLLSKVGIGKKDSKTKEEKKKEKPQDKRTPVEKQKDLDAGVKKGTELLRDNNLDKKEIQKHLEVIEDTYDLQELKIVTDRTEEGKETVHIHGKVNPEKDGEQVNRKTNNDKKVSGWLLTPTDVKDHNKSELEITEQRDGEAYVGYKAKNEAEHGVIVGRSGTTNSFVRKLKEDNKYGDYYNRLTGLELSKRMNIISGGSSTHNKFYPVGIKENLLSDGRKEITYRYADGEQQFTVILNADGYPTSIKGDKLTIHDLGRGTTQDSEGKIINAGMDAAHLIANMFGGSGYREAQNIIATSAEYNQVVMREKEDLILAYVKGEKTAKYFSMQVDLEFVKDNTTFEIAAIRKALADHARADDDRHGLSDAALLQQIETRLKQTNQKRVKKVIYRVELFTDGDISIKKQPFFINEPDLLFGTR